MRRGIPFGPMRRRATPTGVPADHFPKATSRWAAYDHQGRITALVADGPEPSPEPTEAELIEAFSDEWESWGFDAVTTIEEVEYLRAMAAEPEPTVEPEVTVTVNRLTPDELAARLAEGSGKRTRVKFAFQGDDDPWLELPVEWDEAAGDFALTAAAGGADLPQLVDNPGAPWHAYLCVENTRTDEQLGPYSGRELVACEFPDLPVSLRFQIHDEGGHYGAVTCGAIQTMERQDVSGQSTIYATGTFGTDEHSQVAQLKVMEETQRFVSVDLRGGDCEEVIVQVSTGSPYDYDVEPETDAWLRYIGCTIGAATVVATPALPQAVIALASQELPEAPIANAAAPTAPVVASAAPIDLAAPPAEWFADPGFHVGDPRLVRQADGGAACPLTVTDDGRVFGHIAHWGGQHTAFPGVRRPPPHSPTYAYFMTGSRTVLAEEGPSEVAVGQITMGCGHASTSAGAQAAIAHYDGGYGAIEVCDVVAGEDDFGIWVAGALRDGVSVADLRKFKSLAPSGDWRKIAGQLHLVACLQVPVPGFPIAREAALTASAELIDSYATRAAVVAETGEVTALVAAGRVMGFTPEERLAALEQELGPILAFMQSVRAGEVKAKLRMTLGL